MQHEVTLTMQVEADTEVEAEEQVKEFLRDAECPFPTTVEVA